MGFWPGPGRKKKVMEKMCREYRGKPEAEAAETVPRREAAVTEAAQAGAAARAEEGARGQPEPPPPDAATQRLYIR